VVYVVFPKVLAYKINPTKKSNAKPTRWIVGTLNHLKRGAALLMPSNKSIEKFRLSIAAAEKFNEAPEEAIFPAKYVYGSWKEDHKWLTCTDVEQFGQHKGNIEDESAALLTENGVDHGEFLTSVFGRESKVGAWGQYSYGSESGWKPTVDL
jgi:hypothetical protein